MIPRPVPLLVESFVVRRLSALDPEVITEQAFRDSPRLDADEADRRLGEFRRDEAERAAL